RFRKVELQDAEDDVVKPREISRIGEREVGVDHGLWKAGEILLHFQARIRGRNHGVRRNKGKSCAEVERAFTLGVTKGSPAAGPSQRGAPAGESGSLPRQPAGTGASGARGTRQERQADRPTSVRRPRPCCRRTWERKQPCSSDHIQYRPN